MRLHELRATAFGPFAETVTVDFDALGEDGVFLLSGATGSGKSSILDAVCFALYGDVPGDRGTAKRLRCDAAAPEVEPRVVLEATLAGRRFRLERTPSWQRPKRRGAGTTTAQASVTLSERLDGAEGSWQPLSSRIDEVGHLVTRLLGMNLTQFTQVALLPQGRFQTFLRARSEERQQLLQRLFQTGRFADVESWLGERRRSLRHSAEAHAQQVEVLLARMVEVSGTAAPDDAATHAAWADELAADAAERLEVAVRRATSEGEREQLARAGLAEARELHQVRGRAEAAAAEREQVEAADPAAQLARAELEAAHRAAPALPLVLRHERALEAHRLAVAAAAGVVVTASEATATAHEARQRAAEVRAALPVERQLASLEGGVVALTRRHASLTETVAVDERLLAAIEARDSLETLQSRLVAHARVGELEVALAAAEEAHRAARDALADARSRALDIREARLEGMAAEIAGSLAVGSACPVCGSGHHPRRAEPTLFTFDDATERDAQRGVDDAASLEHLRGDERRDVALVLERAREQAGAEPAATVAAQAEVVGETLAAMVEALRGTEALDRDGRPRGERDAVAQRLRQGTGTRERTAAELAAAVEATEAARTQVARLLADDDAPTLAELLARHEAREREAQGVLELLTRRADAADALGEAVGELDHALASCGLASAQAVREAARPPQVTARLTARLAEHERRRAAADAVLDEPAAQAALALDALPDLEALAQAHAAALADLGEARSEESAATHRSARLRDLAASLAEALTGWEPVRAELELTTALAAFVEGKSADNRLQMRLSAYVLAYRLSQVVAAANERLVRMSDDRYTLEHVAARGAGETRGGLSLLVHDSWSGEARDPATLSGGETFVVSLALALGLADVIAHEAGGAALDTLFVDEGFGSLDADTLDDVLDVLDTLREGGRVVGVVSHVAEMRERIPTQLHLTKSRRGSTVTLVR